MLGTKLEIADVLSIETAEEISKDCGVAIVVTDGKNIQIEIE